MTFAGLCPSKKIIPREKNPRELFSREILSHRQFFRKFSHLFKFCDMLGPLCTNEWEPEEITRDPWLDYVQKNYHVKPCTNTHPHEWDCCLGYHDARDRRRDTPHSHLPCGHVKIEAQWGHPMSCPNFPCSEAHTRLEVMFHPKNYKTQWCARGSTCQKGIFCAFAHSLSELDMFGCRPKDSNVSKKHNVHKKKSNLHFFPMMSVPPVRNVATIRMG